MANITPVSAKVPGIGNASTSTWTISTGDTGLPASNAAYADRSIQVAGTIAGSTVTIEGSNDGANYVGLTDTGGVALTFTAVGLKQALQVTKFIRPVVTAGTAAGLTVTLLMVGK
jgi:hypothetical protein